MKKLLSMLMCICIMASAMTTIALAADTPEFVDINASPYVISIANSKTFVPTVENDYGTLTLSERWTVSTASTNDLLNGTELNYHLYNSSKPVDATYTFTQNVPAGRYYVQYLIPHANVATAYPVTLTVGDGEPVQYSMATTKSQGWVTLDTINYTAGNISLYMSSDDSDGYFRTAAVRLLPVYDTAEYIIRNTTTTAGNETFAVSSGWKASGKYTIEGENSIAQLVSNAAGAYSDYKFIKTETPVAIYNSDSYTGIVEGYYDVYFCNPQVYSANDAAAVVTVNHNGTATGFTLNTLTAETGKWTMINDPASPLYFTGDGTEYVRIAQGTSGKYIRAGAIRLVKKIVASTPEVKPLVSGAAYADGALTIVTNGTSLNDNKTVYAVVAAYTDSGALLSGVKTTPVAITKCADDVTVPVNLPTAVGTSYKLLVIDSFANAKPIIASYDFNK